MLTQPIEGNDEACETWAKSWVKTAFNKPGNVFLHPIHRLDRVASGIVLFARTSKALARLQKASREKKYIKKYIACVEGTLLQDEGQFEDQLEHGDHRAVISKEGKWSSLKYRVINRHKSYTLVEIWLETGRYHQIRAQFSSRNHPIVGDKKYGSQIPFLNDQTIALHHVFLQVPHPVERQSIQWSSLPACWPIDLIDSYGKSHSCSTC